MTKRAILLAAVAVLLPACIAIEPSCTSPSGVDKVYVIEHGWHAELGVPVEELDRNMAFLRAVFPGVKAIIFGYGKKTFLTAPPQTISEYILGPLPGPAVIQVIGLNVMPEEAYGKENTTALTVGPNGMAALLSHIWGDFEKDGQGEPVVVGPSIDPAGLFYASNSGYSLLHTCNAWTSDVLHSAGLPIKSDGVVFSGQVVSQVNDAASDQCSSFEPSSVGKYNK